MSQKQAKKLRKKLRDERAESERLAVERPGKPMPKALLMRRKDPIRELNGLARGYQGGAILHPLSERAQYQFAKKRGLGG